MGLWRILRRMFGRKAPEPETTGIRDPAVTAALSASNQKAEQTHQLLAELRSRTDKSRLDRARLLYDERLYGTRGDSRLG